VTDEQFGRAWAKQQGIGPTMLHWFERLPPMWTWNHIPGVGHIPDTRSEAAAYAELGRAVRWVHAAVPPLRGA
jgi:hypothetical protein